ncbi:hyaluronan mediated motility receptor-like protein [Rhynchospora pubera]|uniref:Hyaluronan mediated motility receptor-like protein n=1 Tax=Rhynchospora pubera TaxID=906938 RepID=A0AAV8C0T2_9POAL|nr:hyaluronan mediated motility receptor-like protein [Rhynchospora pubera]
MTSRPIVLVFLLLVLIITSQFEWKQQIEAEGNRAVSRKKQLISEKEETVKEKIILSQEKSIQQLNELVQSLQLQLLHCRGTNSTIVSSQNATNDEISEVEDHDSVRD